MHTDARDGGRSLQWKHLTSVPAITAWAPPPTFAVQRLLWVHNFTGTFMPFLPCFDSVSRMLFHLTLASAAVAHRFAFLWFRFSFPFSQTRVYFLPAPSLPTELYVLFSTESLLSLFATHLPFELNANEVCLFSSCLFAFYLLHPLFYLAFFLPASSIHASSSSVFEIIFGSAILSLFVSFPLHWFDLICIKYFLWVSLFGLSVVVFVEDDVGVSWVQLCNCRYRWIIARWCVFSGWFFSARILFGLSVFSFSLLYWQLASPKCVGSSAGLCSSSELSSCCSVALCITLNCIDNLVIVVLCHRCTSLPTFFTHLNATNCLHFIFLNFTSLEPS